MPWVCVSTEWSSPCGRVSAARPNFEIGVRALGGWVLGVGLMRNGAGEEDGAASAELAGVYKTLS